MSDACIFLSHRIVCITQRVDKATNGNVQVTIEGETVAYEFSFTYQNPALGNIHPKRGPRDGGTLITVTGSELDTGGEIVVSLGSARCMVKL